MIRRTRQILLLALAILVPLSAWLVHDHVRMRNRLIEEATERTREAAATWAESMRSSIDAVRAAVEEISQLEGSSRDRKIGLLRDDFPESSAVILHRIGDSVHEVGLRALSPGRVGWVTRVGGSSPPEFLFRVPISFAGAGTPDPVWSRMLVVAPGGEILLRLPIQAPRKVGDQDRQKFSSQATRAAGELGDPDVGVYRDLDDKDVVGAWHPVPDIGAVVVEEQCKDALASVLGPRPWHFAVGLLVLIFLPLVLLEIARRWPSASSLLRLYAFAKPYWPTILLIVLAMGAYAGGSGAQLYMVSVLVEDVLLESDTDHAWRILLLLSAVMFVVVFLMALGRYFRAYLSAKVTQSVINDIRCRVGAHLLTLSLGFFHRRRQGTLLSRLTNDVGQSRRSLRLIFGDIVQEPLLLAGAIAAGFATNWRLALMVFIAFPALIVPISRFGRRIKRYAKKRQVKRAEVTNTMVQMLSGVRIVKAFRMEKHEARRLRTACNRLLRQSLKVARTTALSESVLEVFNTVGAVSIFLAGGYFVLNSLFDITVADLVTFSAILTRMYKPVKNLTKTYNKVQDSLPSVERVFEILDLRPDIEDGPDARPLGKPERAIAFEGVSFAYEEEPVLRDVSFEVPVGSILALVGPTGAGKSTLTDLVARYYDPQSGRITIDGIDLREYAVDSLLSHVAIVTQEPFLFHTTIRENILYGRPGATAEEVEAAAKAAFVHAEIMEQPEGYDTVVGDRGGRLSGGQRQRVTIARAILKDADILILDEATSSLDSRSEGEVQRALSNLMEGRTTFVVAHRLSTIRNADRILVLERGRIIESGGHDELIEAGGLYATLHAMQDGGAGAASGARTDG